MVEHCCLYDEGKTRIGCICCPMASYKQKMEDIQRWPHIKRNWIRVLREIDKKQEKKLLRR